MFNMNFDQLDWAREINEYFRAFFSAPDGVEKKKVKRELEQKVPEYFRNFKPSDRPFKGLKFHPAYNTEDRKYLSSVYQEMFAHMARGGYVKGLRLMLEAGLDRRHLYAVLSAAIVPLARAGNLEGIKLILETGFDPNTNLRGDNPLSMCVVGGISEKRGEWTWSTPPAKKEDILAYLMGVPRINPKVHVVTRSETSPWAIAEREGAQWALNAFQAWEKTQTPLHKIGVREGGEDITVHELLARKGKECVVDKFGEEAAKYQGPPVTLKLLNDIRTGIEGDAFESSISGLEGQKAEKKWFLGQMANKGDLYKAAMASFVINNL